MQLSAEKVWGSVQESLQSVVNADLFKLWFAPIRPKGIERDTLTLEVVDDFSVFYGG